MCLEVRSVLWKGGETTFQAAPRDHRHMRQLLFPLSDLSALADSGRTVNTETWLRLMRPRTEVTPPLTARNVAKCLYPSHGK